MLRCLLHELRPWEWRALFRRVVSRENKMTVLPTTAPGLGATDFLDATFMAATALESSSIVLPLVPCSDASCTNWSRGSGAHFRHVVSRESKRTVLPTTAPTWCDRVFVCDLHGSHRYGVVFDSPPAGPMLRCLLHKLEPWEWRALFHCVCIAMFDHKFDRGSALHSHGRSSCRRHLSMGPAGGLSKTTP